MPFTLRVQLHGGTERHYEQLHEAMEQRGFSRFIRDGKGVIYSLPQGEYRYEGHSEINTITNAAKSAAASTGCRYGVLVSESLMVMWYGLEVRAP